MLILTLDNNYCWLANYWTRTESVLSLPMQGLGWVLLFLLCSVEDFCFCFSISPFQLVCDIFIIMCPILGKRMEACWWDSNKCHSLETEHTHVLWVVWLSSHLSLPPTLSFSLTCFFFLSLFTYLSVEILCTYTGSFIGQYMCFYASVKQEMFMYTQR